MKFSGRLMASVAGLSVFLALVKVAAGQRLPPPGLPLSMTMTLEKPGPEQSFGGRRVIELGVDQQSFRFVLRDLYVDDPEGRIVGDDVWRAVERSRPNLMVRGWNQEAIGKIKPGEVVTVQGIYAPITRTFEVAEVRSGPGLSAPPPRY